jgi:hypothetical protein
MRREHNSMENVYQENGYNNRKEYLQSLSNEYDVPLNVVYELAELLGESEDFDGLVSVIEDAEGIEW